MTNKQNNYKIKILAKQYQHLWDLNNKMFRYLLEPLFEFKVIKIRDNMEIYKISSKMQKPGKKKAKIKMIKKFRK